MIEPPENASRETAPETPPEQTARQIEQELCEVLARHVPVNELPNAAMLVVKLIAALRVGPPAVGHVRIRGDFGPLYTFTIEDDLHGSVERWHQLQRVILDALGRVGPPPADTTMPTLVAGDVMSRPIYEFVRACEHHLADEQAKANPDNALIAVLCDAVRLSREMTALATKRNDA